MEEQEQNQVQEDVPETPAEKSYKDTFFENIRRKYPDQELSEEDIYRNSMSGYDAEHDWKKKTLQDNEEFAKKLMDNPDIATFMRDIVNGESPNVAAQNLRALMDLEEGTPEYDAYMDKVAKQKASSEEAQRLADEFQSNLEKSQEDIQNFASTVGMSEDEVERFIGESTQKFLDPLMKGQLNTDLLQDLYKIYRRDDELAGAEERGYKRGKNEQIVEKHKSLRNGSDGLPNVQGGGASSKAEDDGIDELMRAIGERGDNMRRLF